jgi:hypothetical protein
MVSVLSSKHTSENLHSWENTKEIADEYKSCLQLLHCKPLTHVLYTHSAHTYGQSTLSIHTAHTCYTCLSTLFMTTKIQCAYILYIRVYCTETQSTRTYLCSGVRPFSPVHEQDTSPNPLHLLHVHLSKMFPLTLSIPMGGREKVRESVSEGRNK